MRKTKPTEHDTKSNYTIYFDTNHTALVPRLSWLKFIFFHDFAIFVRSNTEYLPHPFRCLCVLHEMIFGNESCFPNRTELHCNFISFKPMAELLENQNCISLTIIIISCICLRFFFLSRIV